MSGDDETVGGPRKSDGVVTRRIAGEVLLVPTTGELAALQKIFVLDPVAEVVWEHLDGSRDLDALTALVTGEFDVGAGQAKSDISEFVDQLLEAGLAVGPSAAGDRDDAELPPDHR